MCACVCVCVREREIFQSAVVAHQRVVGCFSEAVFMRIDSRRVKAARSVLSRAIIHVCVGVGVCECECECVS